MIENYSVFYKFKKHHEVLIVVFNYGLKATKYVKSGDLGIVFSDDTPIAYNFFNINKFMKIHVHNMIYTPSDALIDALNLFLGKKYEHLSYKKESGYRISKVNNKLYVLAGENMMLNNGKIYKEKHICTSKELGINEEEKIYEVEEKELEGCDFFLMEEK